MSRHFEQTIAELKERRAHLAEGIAKIDEVVKALEAMDPEPPAAAPLRVDFPSRARKQNGLIVGVVTTGKKGRGFKSLVVDDTKLRPGSKTPVERQGRAGHAVCSRCRQARKVEQFGTRNGRIEQPCKVCRAEISRERYQKTHPKARRNRPRVGVAEEIQGTALPTDGHGRTLPIQVE